MADSRDDEVPEVKAETSDTSERQKDFTRRALLRAGWVVPAVTAINIPSASAQTPAPHNDVHGDMRTSTTSRSTPTSHRHAHADASSTSDAAYRIPTRRTRRRRTPTRRTSTTGTARRSHGRRRRTRRQLTATRTPTTTITRTAHADFIVQGPHRRRARRPSRLLRTTPITPTRAATRITSDNGHRDHTDGAFGHKDSQAYVDHTDTGHQDHIDSTFPSPGSPGRAVLGSPRRLPPGPSATGPTVTTITPTATIRITSTTAIVTTPMPAIRTRLVQIPIETIPTSCTPTTATAVHIDAHSDALRRTSTLIPTSTPTASALRGHTDLDCAYRHRGTSTSITSTSTATRAGVGTARHVDTHGDSTRMMPAVERRELRVWNR